MKKLNYQEIMDSIKEEGKVLTPAHLKAVKQALDEAELSKEDKELESLKVISMVEGEVI